MSRSEGLAMSNGRACLALEFVLVDCENVQPKNVGQLSGRPFQIKIFLGSNQAKIPVEMVQALS
jgi:hypothetical protein